MLVRRALALAVVPLLLAGCSEEEPTPKMPDPTTSSSTPTPAESATPEAESPEDFIRRWVEANTEMQNTGDVAPYVALSRRCKPCNATADRVKEIYARGGFVETRGWIVKRVIDRTGSTGAPVLDLRVSSSPTKFQESAGSQTQSLEGGAIVMRVRLTRGEPWEVVNLTQVAS